MTPETFINAKLTLHERATPVMINSEFIYKLMEDYHEIKVKEVEYLAEDKLTRKAIRIGQGEESF